MFHATTIIRICILCLYNVLYLYVFRYLSVYFIVERWSFKSFILIHTAKALIGHLEILTFWLNKIDLCQMKIFYIRSDFSKCHFGW